MCSQKLFCSYLTEGLAVAPFLDHGVGSSRPAGGITDCGVWAHRGSFRSPVVSIVHRDQLPRGTLDVAHVALTPNAFTGRC